jgi:hypothetical protein
MVARQPLATVREARYGYAVANMGSNPHRFKHNKGELKRIYLKKRLRILASQGGLYIIRYKSSIIC